MVFCLGKCAVMLMHRASGDMPHATQSAEDLTFESFECYLDLEWDTPPDDDPNWYLSTDNDPHIFWQGEAFVVSVRLEVEQLLPPGSVALYYLTPGQTDYRESQKVYAWRDGDNAYVFDLGGINQPFVADRQVGDVKSFFFQRRTGVENRVVLKYGGNNMFFPLLRHQMGNPFDRPVVRL